MPLYRRKEAWLVNERFEWHLGPVIALELWAIRPLFPAHRHDVLPDAESCIGISFGEFAIVHRRAGEDGKKGQYTW